MNVLLIIVTLEATIVGYKAQINQCTSLLPQLYIVPQSISLRDDTNINEATTAPILNEALQPVFLIEKIKGMPTGMTSIYLKTLSNNVLYRITSMEHGPPRRKRQVMINSATTNVPLFMGSDGLNNNPSFVIKVGAEGPDVLVVRCVDTLLYRYQIESQFTKAIEARVVRMKLHLPNQNTYTVSFRSPTQKNKPFIIATAIAMDELLK
jgi:hypothetical protein